MNRMVFGFAVVVASLMLVDSLTCKNCAFAVLGSCFFSSTETCSTNTSVCFTGTAKFPFLSSFSGFSSVGCAEPTGCNMTTNGTLLGATYQVITECCSTDNCNPVQASGNPSVRMTVSATIGAAILASVWGSML